VAPSTADTDAGEETDGPHAQAGQAEQPTSPGGEEQSGEEQSGEEQSGEEQSGEEQSGEEAPAVESTQPVVEDPATEELAAPVTDTGGGGGLPSTGLELGAMAIVGLGLLLLGAALRPRRAVPAHRSD
jgi:hypothetical protein